ncbi:hypothetical protein RHSP_82319 [Rhizobium freirei PRF 81]|uniref:Uncharacterized protein n=1 Tax=Rhizobium freirei PRF 81 TaxID=363754 RepID=N6UUK9_9HYPH|nr:hypothetical protein RHSP_82319 [Rhizobium freirei PRF 81]
MDGQAGKTLAPGGNGPLLRTLRAGTAQDGANTRQKLARIEGFAEIIVGAHLQAENAIDILGLRRQHEDRHLAAGADAAAGRKAILARQHQIENDEIGKALGKDAVHRGSAVGGLHGKALAAQELLQERSNLAVVLDQKKRCGNHNPPCGAEGGFGNRETADVTNCNKSRPF